MLGGGSCFAMNLARHMVDRGDEVLAISRSPMRTPPFTYGLERERRFRYEQAHIGTHPQRTLGFLSHFKPEVIVNFAALCEVGQSWNHPLDYYATNLMALVRLVGELEGLSWFRKFVQIGSSEVYGSVDRPATEEFPIRPSSPYAASKAVFDFHLQAISRHQGFPAIVVLPSNGYCEGQTLNRIIPKTIIAAKTGGKVQLQGGGVARKSYLHADDISRAILLIAEKGVLGQTYNVGPETPVSIRRLMEMTLEAMGAKFDDIVELAPERTGQDSQYWLDSSRVKELGWHQRIALNEGLRRMIGWVKTFPELLTMDAGYIHKP